MQKKKVLVLFEPNHLKGHYESQLYTLIFILKKKYDLIILNPEIEKIQRWIKINLGKEGEDIILATFPLIERKKVWYRFLYPKTSWKRLNKTIKEIEQKHFVKVELVFCANIDVMLPGAIWRAFRSRFFIKYNWTGFLFRASELRLKQKWRAIKKIRKWLHDYFFFSSAKCKSLGIFDEALADMWQNRIGKTPLVVLPDVSDKDFYKNNEVVEQIKFQADKKTVIGLFGVLERRKSVLEFLYAVENSDEKTFFILVGYLPKEQYTQSEINYIEFVVNKYKDRLFFSFEYVEDPKLLNSYINACDVLFLVYKKFLHSSGFLSKAAFYKKIVIGSNGNYCFADRIKKYKMGILVDENKKEEICTTIKAISDRQLLRSLKTEALFDEFEKVYNECEFEKHVYRLIEG